MDMEARLCMTHALYWYEESKPNDDEDDHVNRVKKDGLVKLLGQFIGSLVPEFKNVSGYTQITYNDYVWVIGIYAYLVMNLRSSKNSKSSMNVLLQLISGISIIHYSISCSVQPKLIYSDNVFMNQ